jgi:hypothetical protein
VGREQLAEGHYQRLKATLDHRGKAAEALIPKLEDIVIPVETALDVFNEVTVPRFWLLTWIRTSYLPEDAQAVMLSLVFNRRLVAFRKSACRNEKRFPNSPVSSKFDKIPGRIRAMKRLWEPTSGLIRRREDEAKLWEAAFA